MQIAASKDFDIKQTIKNSFQLFQENFKSLLILSLCLVFPMYLATGFLMPDVAAKTAVTPATAMTFIPCFILFVISIPVCMSAVGDMIRGKEFDFSASLTDGCRRFFPFLASALCISVIVLLGFIALIVPGVIAMAALYFTVAFVVIERQGPIESLRSSALLSKGRRWKILGYISASGIILFIISLLANLSFYFFLDFIKSLLGGAGSVGETTASVLNVLKILFGALTETVVYPLSTVFMLEAYDEIRKLPPL